MNAYTCCYRDVWHAIASLLPIVHSVMIRLDSAVASQVLQVACVNAVRLASGTIAEMDACVSPTVKILKSIRVYLSVRFFLTAVAVFRKPNTIPLCFSIDLVLSFLLSWLLVILPSTFFLDVLFSFSHVVSIP